MWGWSKYGCVVGMAVGGIVEGWFKCWLGDESVGYWWWWGCVRGCV